MILVFLGSMRATSAVLLSIPLSALATFLVLGIWGSSINSMVLGGLALAFSRLIDNSVVVLENIYRHLEMGKSPAEAAEVGGAEVALPVLAATLTTAVVFFPVTFLYGVSRFLFSALALAVVISLAASYIVAMTVVPLFCARLLKAGSHSHGGGAGWGARFNAAFDRWFGRVLDLCGSGVRFALGRPAATVAVLLVACLSSVLLVPALGLAFFPRTDAGQFVVNLKAPPGTRLELTEREVEKAESLIRRAVDQEDLGMLVSNIGTTPDFSAIYSSNSAEHTGFVQVSLKEGHKHSSAEYMQRVQRMLASEMPHLTTYFQSGGLVDAVLNLGLPAPIDVQVSGSNMKAAYAAAAELAQKIKQIPGVSSAYIPQDLASPALRLKIDRTRAGQLGFSQREVVQNLITALTSNQMIAPSYWVDPRTGNDYLLTVQYPDNQVGTVEELRSIPLHAARQVQPTRLDAVADLRRDESPTEVDHYQLRRVIDIYVATAGEDLGTAAAQIEKLAAEMKLPKGVRVDLRGMVQGMRASFRSFAIGLVLAVALLYLILVAQFRSFVDPALILLAVPPGILGVVLLLWAVGTTLNVMSLMGVVMLVGIVVSNSILLVDFTHKLRGEGVPLREALETAVRTRLRPILMTSLATIIGLLPMAMKLGEGSESYAPLAQAIIGGLTVSLALTIFLVPAAYFLVYRRHA
jgi:multidrug efflux pump subunit AcrB